MRIDIITLFPDFIETIRSHSIVGRAIGTGKVELHVHNLRQWSKDSYQSVDDRPYGGGAGMVLRVDVVEPAISHVRGLNPSAKVVLTTPQGNVYTQSIARSFAAESGLIIVAGHYEGWDERIRAYADIEISIGDYVLTGGEIPAMVIADSVARLLPGVLGDDSSSVEESHSDGSLEYPQYTRPPDYKGEKVPEILLSGNHPEIEKWRKSQSRKRTAERRPDITLRPEQPGR